MESGVGNISHILKTAFRDTFEESTKRAQAREARERLASQQASIEHAGDLAGGDAGEEKGEKIRIRDESDISNYYTDFEKLSLYDEFKSYVEDKSASIDQAISEQAENASKLKEYLVTRRVEAHDLEVEEEEDLKRQGVIVGQHIPSLPTKLAIDRDNLDRYGNYSSNLMVARELVGQNRELFLRRTGNLPISQSAEQHFRDRTKKQMSSTENIKGPGYTTLTSAAAVRKDRVAVRYAATTKAREHEQALLLASGYVKPERESIPRKKNVLSAAQRLQDEEILAGINHKLNYLRNPRNIPTTINRMLTRTEQAILGGAEGSSPASPTSHESAVSHSSGHKSSAPKDFTTAPAVTAPLFQTEPAVVSFTEYDAEGAYTATVSFRNVSAISRSLRVLPPAGIYFELGPLAYPPSCRGGMLAPGMCVSAVVTFRPDSGGNYNDCLQVETEGGSYTVPICAQRPAPQLGLPETLDLGICLVGDGLRVVFSCHNSGGKGRFRLLRPEHYPLVPTDVDWATLGCSRFPPFTVYPVEFALPAGESVDVQIEYVPLEKGVHEQVFFLLCDNCDVHKFTIRATCRDVDVFIMDINGTPVDAADASISRDLFFNAANIGSEQLQQLSIANDTGIPLEYEWVWLDAEVDADLGKIGREKLALRAELGMEPRLLPSPQQRSRELATSQVFDESGMVLPPPPSRQQASSRAGSEHGTHGRGSDLLADSAFAQSISYDGSANSAVEKEFSITPARGVIQGDGMQTFSVAFTPSELAMASSRVLLMLRGVPLAAVPHPDMQSAHLQTLLDCGHGSHHRLRSWIDSIGRLAKVNPYVLPNGLDVSNAPLINLITVINLVITHGMGIDGVDDDIAALDVTVRNMLKHYYLWKRQELETDDDASEGEDSCVIVYSWDASDSQNPEPIAPYRLGSTVSMPSDDDVDDADGAQILGNFVFREPERQMLCDIWVDPSTIIRLIGERMSAHFNELVKHDAVEYVQGVARTEVACLSTTVSGSGKLQLLQLLPPQLRIGGLLSLQKVWQGSFTIRNDSSAMAEIEILTSNLSVLALSDADGDDSGEDTRISPGNFTVTVDPSRILVMPETEVSVSVAVQVGVVGTFEISVPLTSTNPHARINALTIVCSTVGPKLRLEGPELDMGLIGVGKSETKTFSLTNESDIPAVFRLNALLNAPEEGSGEARAKGLPDRLDSHRSQQSDDSNAVSIAGSDSFAISNRNVIITMDPKEGSLSPKESVLINVTCKAGSVPERVRSSLECQIFDLSLAVALPPQYLSIRGEVQSPKAVMYPIDFDLGTVYVGVPVTFPFTLENKSNLPTIYRLERPGGESSRFTLEFDSDRGSLDSKQRLVIVATFTALTAGRLDEIIANKVFGVENPLGFSFRALARGAQLDFVTLADGEEAPVSLADPSALRYEGPEEAAKPVGIHPIKFGSVKLYERRYARIAVRNLTAIPTKFTVDVRKYVVEDDKAIAELLAGGGGAPSRKNRDVLLLPHEDGTNKYKSETGNQYLSAGVQRQQDRRFLTTGLGAAYSAYPKAGELPPWGVQVVVLRSFNDMPGCYDDEMVCSVVDYKSTKLVNVPIKMSTLGCPLSIERGSYGMTFSKEEPELKPYLNLGTACVNSEPLTREFKVKNSGSKAARIKWRLQTVDSTAKGLLKVGLDVQEDAKVRVRLQFWSDITRKLPFKIVPAVASVQPYGKQVFVVTVERTSRDGLEQALLCGAVDLREDPLLGSAALEQGSVSSVSSSKASKDYLLTLPVQATLAFPSLRLDKHVFEARDADARADPALGIKLKADSTKLFAKGYKPSAVCRKAITIVNPMQSSLVFTTAVEGPFILDFGGSSTDSSVSSAASRVSFADTATVASSVGASSLGKTFHLLPQSSAGLAVAFAPKKDFRERLSQGSDSSGKPAEENGALVVTYSTGQCLRVPLSVKVSSPFVACSSPGMLFGTCHTTRSVEGLLMLSNPSAVTANWTVAHVPSTGPSRRVSSIKVKGYPEPEPEVDDPSVFIISPDSGVLEGPTISVTSAIAAPPKDLNRKSAPADIVVAQRLTETAWSKSTLSLRDTFKLRHDGQHQSEADAFYPVPLTVAFKPNKNVRYVCRFRFSCQYGNAFDVLLEGKGTYNENEHKPISPMPK